MQQYNLTPVYTTLFLPPKIWFPFITTQLSPFNHFILCPPPTPLVTTKQLSAYMNLFLFVNLFLFSIFHI